MTAELGLGFEGCPVGLGLGAKVDCRPSLSWGYARLPPLLLGLSGLLGCLLAPLQLTEEIVVVVVAAAAAAAAAVVAAAVAAAAAAAARMNLFGGDG